jgi:hypothetical protein
MRSNIRAVSEAMTRATSGISGGESGRDVMT